jgi:S-adenosylmethionine-diacylglycerol 3-amino-3-carboxypropyl transferase
MAKRYFSDLNYSLGNEDTGLEVEMVEILRPKNILSIAGSGGRCLPLIHAGAGKLTCVDISPQQLYLTELREQAISVLSHDDFLLFWGYPPYGAYDYSQKRKGLFGRLVLSKQANEYFRQLFDSIDWGPLIYLGKWEKTFSTLSRVVRLVLGKNFAKIFSFHKLSEQVDYYNNHFPLRKWRSILFMLGNRSVFNALLYKGDFIKKNVPESHFQYYSQAYERLFTSSLARESFFLHLCFYGKLDHEDGNPIECKKEVFEGMKKSLNSGTEVILEELDLVATAKKLTGQNVDFVSLSDVPSYFSGRIEKEYLQDIKCCLALGAVLVLRSYLREPDSDYSDFVDVTPKYSDAIKREKVQMYKVKVLQYNP